MAAIATEREMNEYKGVGISYLMPFSVPLKMVMMKFLNVCVCDVRACTHVSKFLDILNLPKTSRFLIS